MEEKEGKRMKCIMYWVHTEQRTVQSVKFHQSNISAAEYWTALFSGYFQGWDIDMGCKQILKILGLKLWILPPHILTEEILGF